MRLLLTLALALVIIGWAVLVAVWLIRTRPQPERRPPPDNGVLVEVESVSLSKEPPVVVGMGTVIPAREVTIQAEVSGRVVELSDDFVPGGRMAEGDLIARLDDRDYEYAVDRMRAEVERATYELAVEKGRQTVASREWKLLEEDLVDTEANRALALREPHLAFAETTLESAQSALEDARLDVTRTRLRAPFNCMVRTKSAEVGALISPQTPLGTLIGTDRFWVNVTLPVDDLEWIRLPPADGSAPGADVRVVQVLGRRARGATGEADRTEARPARKIVRAGRVVRLLGDLDPAGRMARLLVEIDDPLLPYPDDPEDVGLPLLVGAYVRVEIQGKKAGDAVRIARSSLRDGRKVWVVDGESRLEIRTVGVAWRGRESVLLASGLEAGERIVTSRISIPVPGMKLRAQEVPGGADGADGADEPGDADEPGGATDPGGAERSPSPGATPPSPVAEGQDAPGPSTEG